MPEEKKVFIVTRLQRSGVAIAMNLERKYVCFTDEKKAEKAAEDLNTGWWSKISNAVSASKWRVTEVTVVN